MTSQLFPLTDDPGSLAIRANPNDRPIFSARRRTVTEWVADITTGAARWFGWWGVWGR